MARASDIVRRDLERKIGSGALRPGDTIDEKSLADQFDVSRTPAREAIMQLAAAGLVEIRPRHGAVVTGLSADEAVAVMETLAILEAEAAALAAHRMPRDEVEAMVRVHKESQASVIAQDSDAYILLNATFHETIYSAARNEYLTGLIVSTRKRMAFYHASSLYQKSRLDRSWEEHGRVVEAIAGADVAGARDAMRDHILSGGRVYADLVAALKRTARGTDES